MKLQENISGKIPSSPIIVYHGSSTSNLKIKPNSIMWFTTDKDDAEEWANRTVLGGKDTSENYIYTAEITFNKPYVIGDDKVNPAYVKFEDSDDKMDIYTEIFFDDVEEKEKFISQGYDCFIDNLLTSTTFGIPSQFKKNIKFIKKERVADSIIIDESNEGIDNWDKFVDKIGKKYYHFNESALDLDPEELSKNREEDRELEKVSFQRPNKPMSKELRELLYGKKPSIQKSTTQKTTQKVSSKNNEDDVFTDPVVRSYSSYYDNEYNELL